MVLRTDPDDLGLGGGEPDRVYGIVMELGYDRAIATIVSLIDGTTSMYISSGGGTIGSGEHAPVAEATRAMVAMGQVLVGQTEPTTEFPLPAAGRVRLQLLTVGGGRTAEVAEDELRQGRHPLSPVYHAGQGVITQIRLLQESQQAQRQNG